MAMRLDLETRLVVPEARLAVRSMPRWWLVGAAVLTIGGLVAGPATRTGWLAAAFLWPALAWSGLATRDRAQGLSALLHATPRPLARQLPAVVLAGWLVGLAGVGGGILGRLFAGDAAGAVATLAGSLAVPAIAVALGILSGGPRLFEGLYVSAWYLGPLQHAWPLDFAAIDPRAVAAAVPWLALLLSLPLLAAAVAAERRRRDAGTARFA